MKLSQERAEAVKTFLVNYYGISPDRLVARGYGESQPVASNDTEEGRAQNRRVVFTRIDEYK
jgi:OOP family OmpA-OmpF porin